MPSHFYAFVETTSISRREDREAFLSMESTIKEDGWQRNGRSGNGIQRCAQEDSYHLMRHHIIDLTDWTCATWNGGVEASV
jgi:hypothetical protein